MSTEEAKKKQAKSKSSPQESVTPPERKREHKRQRHQLHSDEWMFQSDAVFELKSVKDLLTQVARSSNWPTTAEQLWPQGQALLCDADTGVVRSGDNLCKSVMSVLMTLITTKLKETDNQLVSRVSSLLARLDNYMQSQRTYHDEAARQGHLLDQLANAVLNSLNVAQIQDESLNEKAARAIGVAQLLGTQAASRLANSFSGFNIGEQLEGGDDAPMKDDEGQIPSKVVKVVSADYTKIYSWYFPTDKKAKLTIDQIQSYFGKFISGVETINLTSDIQALFAVKFGNWGAWCILLKNPSVHHNIANEGQRFVFRFLKGQVYTNRDTIPGEKPKKGLFAEGQLKTYQDVNKFLADASHIAQGILDVGQLVWPMTDEVKNEVIEQIKLEKAEKAKTVEESKTQNE